NYTDNGQSQKHMSYVNPPNLNYHTNLGFEQYESISNHTTNSRLSKIHDNIDEQMLNDILSIPSTVTTKKCYFCPYCNKKYSKLFYLNKHVVGKHLKQSMWPNSNAIHNQRARLTFGYKSAKDPFLLIVCICDDIGKHNFQTVLSLLIFNIRFFLAVYYYLERYFKFRFYLLFLELYNQFQKILDKNKNIKQDFKNMMYLESWCITVDKTKASRDYINSQILPWFGYTHRLQGNIIVQATNQ
ncbi:hypothetical protein RFI_21626, partial [Reticulomyxa filosa]